MSANLRNYTVAVDFDGVIHSYTSPWVGSDVITDPPVEGAIEWLNQVTQYFTVVIHTTRGKTTEGIEAVKSYLLEHGYRVERDAIEVTAIKPPALVYIDDRAWRFEGRFPTRDEIHQARPWNKVKS